MHPQFTTEEQGVASAELVLTELRAFLSTREAPSLPRASASGRKDRDLALRTQLEDLDDMLRRITDSRLARTLVRDEQERMTIRENGSVEMLRFIVTTARDVMVSETCLQGWGSGGDASNSPDGDGDPSECAGPLAGPSRYKLRLREQGTGSRRNEAIGLGAKATSSSKMRTIPSCTVCAEPLATATSRLETPCGHFYCGECTRHLVETYTGQAVPTNPLRCCPSPAKPISAGIVRKFITPASHKTLEDKLLEVNTPPEERIYCPQENCRQFLNPRRNTSSATTARTVVCQNSKCLVSICLGCKKLAHPGIDCQTRADDVRATELQQQFRWGRCPRCRFVVEKISGCNHMLCRCGSKFTYCAPL